MDTISRQSTIDAICTWDKFGVDERGRVVRWHEGLEPYVHLRDVVTAIANAPSAEPEIIRCKDCKHYLNKHICMYFSRYGTIETSSYAYCSYGERGTDE